MTSSGEFPSVSKELGPWLLEAAIGGGVSARVYSAKHRETGVPAALKVLRGDRSRRLEDGVRFLREGRLLSELDHPCIPRLLEMGVDERQRMFLAMQRFEGRDARTVLQGLRDRPHVLRRQVRDQLLLPAWRMITEAIQHAHARGVAHGDITPSNILVDGRGAVGLVDWGLARRFDPPPEPTVADANTDDKGVVRVHGTPGYVAPENLSEPAAGPGPSSDIYSLGAVLYHILAFRPAIEASTIPGRLAAAWQPVVDPRDKSPDMEIPGHLAELAMAAMSINPTVRPSSAAHFLTALDGGP